MRLVLISALLLSLVAGCASVKIGPHRIDVQQGNALDQENVARLKTGLNRSQVRFLLGTPLVVDPFRTDRWDYVYVNYKGGKLAEQKRISLFFEGETLVRIEGDLPAPELVAPPPAPAVQLESKAETRVLSETVAASPVPAPIAPQAVVTRAENIQSAPVIPAATRPEPAPVAPVVKPLPAVAQVQPSPPVATPRPNHPLAVATSIVPPLPSPKNAPAYVDPRPPADISLQPETDVAQIKPDVMPSFSAPAQAADSETIVIQTLEAWAQAWRQRDDVSYLAAYDAKFVPQGGGSRADWEKRRRMLLGAAKNIDLKLESPSVDQAPDGSVTVTFNQFYRSDSYRDAVVKQLRMVERDGRWLIVEEKVLSTLRRAKP